MARVIDRMFNSKIVLGIVWVAGLVSACAGTTLPEVSPTAPPPSGEGVLVGRFGVSADKAAGTEAPMLKLERVSDGRTFDLALAPARSGDGGRSVPFAVRVPPGQYRLTAWRVFYDGGHEEFGEDLGLKVAASAGQVTCVGDVRLHPDHSEKDQALFWLRPRCPELAGQTGVAAAGVADVQKFLVPRRERRNHGGQPETQVARSAP